MVDEEEPTKLQLRADLEAEFSGLLDDAGELEEITGALATPHGIDTAAFAKLAGDLYREVVRRAGLEHADQTDVALVATPDRLLDLAIGETNAGPLVALRGLRN